MVFKNLLKDFYGDIINIKLNIKKNKKLRRIKDHLIYDVISITLFCKYFGDWESNIDVTEFFSTIKVVATMKCFLTNFNYREIKPKNKIL